MDFFEFLPDDGKSLKSLKFYYDKDYHFDGSDDEGEGDNENDESLEIIAQNCKHIEEITIFLIDIKNAFRWPYPLSSFQNLKANYSK